LFLKNYCTLIVDNPNTKYILRLKSVLDTHHNKAAPPEFVPDGIKAEMKYSDSKELQSILRNLKTKQFYGEASICFLFWCWWDCVYPSEGGYCGQVFDPSRQNELSVEWYIQAGPYPSAGQCGERPGDQCKLRYKEEVLLKTGQVSAQMTPESNGIRVQVLATAPVGSDYGPQPVTGDVGSYKLTSPSQYIARYSVEWVPAGPPPPPQEQQSR
jgi:hypothetical protein